MKKILFIVPPHLKFNDYVDPSDRVKVVKKKDGRLYGNLITDMPLGPLALSSYLKKYIPDLETELLDFNVELNSLDAFPFDSYRAYFEDFFAKNPKFGEYDVIGVSCLFSPSYLSLIDLSRTIKGHFPKVTTIAGGNIPSNMYKDLYELEPDAIDLICYGEGELPLLEYLQAKDPDDYVRNSNSWITKEKLQQKSFFPAHHFISDLDDIPIYDYELCGTKYSLNPTYTTYGSHQDRESNFHFLTSRGCPFFCIFCASHKVHGRKMRYYSLDRTKKDILELKEKFGVKTLLFQDDHFMGDPKRALEIVKFVGDLGIRFIFQNSLALYALNREFLEACKRAGMDQLVLAVESGSDRVLKQVMKKPLNLKIVKRVVTDCRELGIYTFCNIVMGLPGETRQDIEDSRAFLRTTYANWFGIYIANPLVGSEMFDICAEKGYLQENWIGSDYKQAVVSTEDWDAAYIEQKAYQMNLELNLLHNSDYRLGNYKIALEAFERVIKAKEGHAVAYFMAAKTCYHLSMKEKGDEYIEEARKSYTNNAFWKTHMDELGVNPFLFKLEEKIEVLTHDEPELEAVGEAKGHFTNF